MEMLWNLIQGNLNGPCNNCIKSDSLKCYVWYEIHMKSTNGSNTLNISRECNFLLIYN